MPLPMYSGNNNQAASPKNGVKKIIAIAAGKGGVGKSTVTVNLALALHSLGYRVGIFDADIYGPSVRKMLPEERPPSQQGDRLIPAICYGGISMMSMAYFRKEKEAAAVRAPIANGIIQQFLQNVEWGNLDFLLIDFPPGTGDIQLTLSQRAHLSGALMVTTPQEVALMDVQKAMHLFNQVKIPLIGLVENMSYYLHEPTGEQLYLFGREGGKKLAKEAKIPFLGGIPLDPEISQCGDRGTPFVSKESTSIGSQAFIALGQAFIKEIQSLEAATSGNLQDFELQWKEEPLHATSSHPTH
ncbi:MAG: Mrp/NBP35 family ATP-binding protein [Parachlamydiaceae bacterium]